MTTRESQMVVIARHADGTPRIWCDPEIAWLVEALNSAGLHTIASCCGHGHRPSRVDLADGRVIYIPSTAAQAATIEAAFPTDINGETR